jgi:vancomycin resistance protein VanJ
MPQAFYLAPLVPLALLALLRRDRAAAGMTAIAAVPVLLIWMDPRPGIRGPVATERARVGVLAYNIEAARGGLEGIQREVRACRPDVIVFCEARRQPGNPDLTAELKQAFPDWHQTAAGDVWIGSRWPIVSSRRGYLPESINREKLLVTVEAPFGRFAVAGLHLSKALRPQTLRYQGTRLPRYLARTTAARQRQIDDALRWLAQEQGPLILAGDFNTPPAGHVYQQFRDRYRDAFLESGLGWGYTFPARLPLLRIDYVWHSPHWEAVSARVGAPGASDHRPVFAELALVR